LTIYALLTLGIIGIGAYVVQYLNKPKLLDSLASGNGRIEATEFDIATKLPGRVVEVSVQEGDDVKRDQVLAKLDTTELDTRLKQAQAQVAQAKQNKKYTLAILKQHESELSLARKNLERSKNLYVNNNISLMQLQQSQTSVTSLQAALNATQAQVIGAQSAIDVLIAQTQTIEVNLNECELRSPIDGRVLYKLIESGEVIGVGGKVLSILDMNDISMTIFLPTSQIGHIHIGSQARIKLDSLPETIIPAEVSFISPDAQFTPKEIETQAEREKLMFRVKVKINPDLLKSGAYRLNSGLPGVAYIRLDETLAWPSELNIITDTQNSK
jgi:HlyD family secretion protein